MRGRVADLGVVPGGGGWEVIPNWHIHALMTAGVGVAALVAQVTGRPPWGMFGLMIVIAAVVRYRERGAE